MEIRHEVNGIRIWFCEKICYVKNYSFHWHKNFEMVRVVNQPCRFWIDGVVIEALPGDIINIGAGILHRYMIDYDDTRLHLLTFSTDVLLKAGVSVNPLKACITAEEMKKNPQLEWQINMLFDLIGEEGKLEKDKDNLFQEHLISALYCLLMRYYVHEKNVSCLHLEHQLFYQIVEYVNTHFDEDINVSVIANKLGVYRTKISSVFLKYADISLKEYLYGLRINKANRILEQGESVTRAALDSGFGTVRNFNRVYKNVTGKRPTDVINNLPI